MEYVVTAGTILKYRVVIKWRIQDVFYVFGGTDRKDKKCKIFLVWLSVVPVVVGSNAVKMEKNEE